MPGPSTLKKPRQKKPPTPKGIKVPSAHDLDPENKWGLNKNKKRVEYKQLTKAEQKNFDEFQNNIHNKGLHPSEAAESWDANYRQLQGGHNQYEIRLSQHNRATFTVDEANKMVHLLQVGGHT